MGRTLIAIVNARSRPEWRNVIRKSWLSQVKDRADVFFFVGRGESVLDTDNVIQLDCLDTYNGLPEKIRAISRWSLKHGYDHTVKIDDDVIFRPNDFLNSDFEFYEYSGRANRSPQPYIVPFGFCYVLNKACTKVISESDLPSDFDDEKWVAKNLWNKGISLTNVSKYSLYHTVSSFVDTSCFAWCIHLEETSDVKLREFNRIFNTYGEPNILTIPPVQPLRPKYEKDGLTVNWWDTHQR